jgi:two-component sensor histidine kinase
VNRLEQERAALRRLASGVGGAGMSDVAPLIRRGTRVILLLLWSFAAAVVLVSGWVLMRHAESHTESTAISLEQFAQRTFTLADFVFDEYEEFLDMRGSVAGAGADPAGKAKLGSLASWLPKDSVVGLALPDGSWAASTVPLPVPPVKVNDREWFQAHMRDGADRHVGAAILSRVSKRYVFTYSAAYRAPGGQLLGIVNIGLPSASMTGLAKDDHYTRLALVKPSGAVVAALPFSPDMVDQPFIFPARPPEGQVTVLGNAFGAWSVTTMRKLPANDLYAVVSVPVLSVLQPLMWGVGIGLPLLLLLTQLLRVMSGQLQDKSRQVEQALADNKVLFQEVHHRVKNNLQVVSSLMRLQTERLPPALRPMMEETSARVRAIALVHEQIYRTASPSDVQLDRFLAQLVQQLSASMIGGMARITTDLQPVTIGLDRAVPVAILATEAITNAIKHGLDDGRGEIVVSLISKGGRNVFAVRDSGTGIREDGTSGLGTRIMTALIRQIDGEWDLGSSTSGGTLFTLSWPA